MLRIFYCIVAILALLGCSKGDPEKSLAEAKLLYQNENYQAAIIELKKSLKLRPNAPEARHLLGKVYLDIGDGAGALKEITLAEKYGDKSKQLDLLKARAYLLSKEYKQALGVTNNYLELPKELKLDAMLLRISAYSGMGDSQNVDKLLMSAEEIDADNVDVLLAKVRYALSRNNYKKAAQYLSLIDSIAPQKTDSEILRGMLHLQKNEFQQASNVFSKVIAGLSGKRLSDNEFSAHVGNIQSLLSLSEKKKAEAAINEFLVRSPKHPIPLYFEAVISYDKKDYSKVKNNLQNVLAILPNHYPSLLLLGAANYADDNYEQANKFLTKFVNRVPTHTYARKLLGITRVRLDRSDEALEILKAGITDTQEDSELLALIGRVSMRTDIPSAVDYFQKASESKPDNADLRMQLAKAYIASGSLDKAIEELKFVGGESIHQAEALEVFSKLKSRDYAAARALSDKLLEKYPDDARFFVIRASVEISAGYKKAAEKYLNTAIKLQDDNIVAMLTLAKLKVQSGELAVARKWFERVTKLEPAHLMANLGLAELSERQGRSQEAIAILKKTGEDHPGEYIPQAALAGYYMQKGKTKDARDLLKRAVQNHSHPNLWMLLGQSYETLNDWKGASDSYRQYITLVPESASAHVSLAKIYAITGDKEKAKSLLADALKIKPGFIPAYAGQASLAISNEDFTKANAIGRELVTKSPKSPAGYVVLANSALKQKKYLESKQYFVKAFNLQPGRNVLKQAYSGFLQAGERRIAIELLAAWRDKYPNDEAARLLLATKYQEEGKTVAAEKEYRFLLEKSPDNPMILNNLALLRLPKDPVEAKTLAAKAYKGAATNAAIMDTFGWVLVQNKEYTEGLAILEDAAKLNPHPDIRYHLAFALGKVGQNSRAKPMLFEILAANPEFAERESAEQLLESLK